jgi:hypothetical protein
MHAPIVVRNAVAFAPCWARLRRWKDSMKEKKAIRVCVDCGRRLRQGKRCSPCSDAWQEECRKAYRQRRRAKAKAAAAAGSI